MAQEKSSRLGRALCLTALFLLLFTLCRLFPLVGDDWFREALGASLHSPADLLREVAARWSTINGRVLGNILAYISIGDRQRDIERLVSALAEIRRRFKRDKSGLLTQEYIEPQVLLTPQQAFYAPKESLPLAETLGRISSEFVMCYPPGIPIVAPGEQITPEILAYISYAKEKGSSLTGPEDAKIERLNVII